MQTIYIFAGSREEAARYLKERRGIALGVSKAGHFVFLTLAACEDSREGAFIEVPGVEGHPDYKALQSALSESGWKQIPISSIKDNRLERSWSNPKPKPPEKPKPYSPPKGTCMLGG